MKPSSLPFGTTHSSESVAHSPTFGASNSSMSVALSVYVIASASMPSALYASMVSRKTAFVKRACSFSLAKLMQSCSSELSLKTSKPKMSTMPMIRIFSSSLSTMFPFSATLIS